MKVGIITQPLLENYGGILQNYALQQVLRQLGHEPVTIDVLPFLGVRRFIFSTVKSLILWFIPSRRRKFMCWKNKRHPLFIDFINKQIAKTSIQGCYSMKTVDEYNLEALVVGSDQVWRPMYNVRVLPDMFLRFACKFNGKKIAYAASFGVDKWELTQKQRSICASLVQRFDAVSVREKSGVALCKKYLGVDAVPVLDPTLLLKKEAYAELCANVPKSSEHFLAAYVLDVSEETDRVIAEEAERHSLSVCRYSAEKGAKLTVEEWIAIFRDANFIVTDSFHGTVFSIIFEKPFRLVENEKRGGARFTDLLEKYHSGMLKEWRENSLDFLRVALEC